MPPKKEFSALSMMLTLVGACAGAALALAAVNELTKEPIKEAKRLQKLEAIQYVLPQKKTAEGSGEKPEPLYANSPDADMVSVTLDDGRVFEVYPARDGSGKFLGAAFPVSDPKGYGGQIKMMVGLDPEGKIIRISLLEHKETPGLGDAMGKDKFLDPLLGKSADSIKWRVKKDKGDVDAVTAATISSRAAVRAIALSFEIFEQAKKQHHILDAK